MSRNYIAKIEAGLQEPGARVLVALESLRVRLINNPVASRVDRGNETKAPLAVHEGAAAYGNGAEIEREIRRSFDALIVAAEGDPERLHWIAVQFREHFEIPKSWKKARGSGIMRIEDPAAKTLLSTHTGLPINQPLRGARSA